MCRRVLSLLFGLLIMGLVFTDVLNSKAVEGYLRQIWSAFGNGEFNQLVITGSHGIGTSAISAKSKVSLGSDVPISVWIEKVSNMLPHSARKIVTKWSKTQPSDIRQQLESSIRTLYKSLD